MVLGSSENYKNGVSVPVDYLIHIKEINPWPPSQSLKSLRSVFIKWENGDRKSGSTKTVVPSVGKIEFTESFRLRVSLLIKEASIKSREDVAYTFQKNLLEFNLYEPRRDNKAQLLATGVVDLADCGVVKNTMSISVSMNSKRSFSKIQPILYLKIQPVHSGRRSNTTSRSYNLPKEASLSKNIGESVSTLIEHAQEAELSCFIDDDDSSQENGAMKLKKENKHGSSSKMRISYQSSSIDSMSDTSSRVTMNYIDDIDEIKHSENKEDTRSLNKGILRTKENVLNDVLKHVKSSSDSNGLANGNRHAEAKEAGPPQDTRVISGFLRTNEKKDISRSFIVDSKVQQLEHKVKMLEGELREAAGMEAALYSVAAEHGSSTNKIHAPARRLSRLYLYACKESCQLRRASAARNAVSGLVLVAKACGYDVPKLTFWLSNSVVLRSIISQATQGPELSAKKDNRKLSFGDWEDPHSFTSALEMVEAWIFNRIIESIWWQTLTPHMQSAATKAIDGGASFIRKKNSRRKSGSSDQKQESISSELWKKVFKDACERICPVRAGGHACGCLPILARLIMEQCVARLDVAMFNAILRESADEIPTDPVSDPISDSKVLPIPSGKASFGAGVQLKNAIGNWSRWLTVLFGLDDDDAPKDENEYGYNGERRDSSFKSFYFLNALSDIMMLPKDLLLSTSVRKEVCSAFGAPLIKRVLDKFVPDEFCPDPIPDVVLQALESEDVFEAGEDSIVNFPCIAAALVYTPPSVASIACIIGEEADDHIMLKRSGFSVDRKSYTSDDELDELNSPLASILMVKPSLRKKENGSQNCIRYELLRDVWINSE